MSDEALGFAQIPHALTMYAPLSDGAYRTYALLLKYARQHGKCWASYERLARERNTTRRTIMRHIKELESLNMLEREQRTGETTMLHVKYVVQDGDKIVTPQD